MFAESARQAMTIGRAGETPGMLDKKMVRVHTPGILYEGPGSR